MLLCFALLNVLSLAQSKKNTKKPNFVIIVADDLGWDDVGFHGSPEVKTPNIDKLASRGVILNDYYVQPICTPTRSALLTGKYPIRNGMQSSVIMTSQPWGLGLEEKLLPQHLKELNYKTHLVGKWHLGFFSKEYLPLRRGFDTFFGCYAGRGDFWDHSSEAAEFNGLDLRDGDKPVLNEWGNYSTSMFTDIAVDRILNHKGSDPMFLMVSHLAVHSANSKAPLQAPEEEKNLFTDIKHAGRKTYLAMVASLDKGVGRVYDALKEAKMLDNTIIIFTTDNGGAPKDFDSNQGSNYPFRGIKTSLFEGGVRAAGFVYSPLIKEKSRVSGDLLHITDWFPTILSLAGGSDPNAEGKIDGKNVWETLSGGAKSPRHEVLLNIDDLVYKNSALRKGKWKILFQDPNEWTEWFNPPDYEREAYKSSRTTTDSEKPVIECEDKPTATANCSNGCLFDIEADPCEYEDVSEDHSDIFDDLKERLDKYRKEMVEPRYKHDADPNSNPRNHGGIWTPWIEESGTPVPHKPLAAGQELPGRPMKNEATGATTTPAPPVTQTAAIVQQPPSWPPQQQNPVQMSKRQQKVKSSNSSRNEDLDPLDSVVETHDEKNDETLKKINCKNLDKQLHDNSLSHKKETERDNNLAKIVEDVENEQQQESEILR